MNKNEFMTKVSNGFNKVAFELKKASPEILLYGGIGLSATAAIIACVKTIDAHKKIEESKTAIDEAKAEAKDSDELKKEVGKICVRTGADILKIYGPALIIGTAGVTSILASHGIVKNRNVALSAAYGALDNSFQKYRDRIRAEHGDEYDQDVRNGIVSKKVDVVEKDPETGKDKKKKKAVKLVDPDKKDIFTTYFDNRSPEYSNQHDYNMVFLRAQQAYASNLLQSKGYLFLNDVYDMIGLPRTIEGQVLGWIYDANNANRHNYVDFGIVESYEEDEFGDRNPVIMLDPNIDGQILNEFTK